MFRQFICLVFGVIFLMLALPGYTGDFDTLIPTLEKDSITYYVSGKIEGFGETEFMVDTGSGYTAINERALETLREAGTAEFVESVYGTMANGQEVELPVYRISSITIGDECIVRNVQAVVIPGKTRNILGLSALKQTAPFAMSVNPPRLMLSQCADPGGLMVSKAD